MKLVFHSGTTEHTHVVVSEGPRKHSLHVAAFCSRRRKIAAKAAPQAQEQEQYTVRLESLGCPKNVVDGDVDVSTHPVYLS